MVWGSTPAGGKFFPFFLFWSFCFCFLRFALFNVSFCFFFLTYFHFLWDLKCTNRLIIINYCKFIISFHFQKLILLSAIGQWGGVLLDLNLHVCPRVNLKCSQITRRSQGWLKFSSAFSFVNNQWKLNGFVNVPFSL